jgi:hypothetical protein
MSGIYLGASIVPPLFPEDSRCRDQEDVTVHEAW